MTKEELEEVDIQQISAWFVKHCLSYETIREMAEVYVEENCTKAHMIRRLLEEGYHAP